MMVKPGVDSGAPKGMSEKLLSAAYNNSAPERADCDDALPLAKHRLAATNAIRVEFAVLMDLTLTRTQSEVDVCNGSAQPLPKSI